MADVILDSLFNWGPIRTGLEEMRLFAQETTRGISSDIKGMFAGAVSVTAVTAAIRSIVDEAHEIHATSERFRLDAQELQTIGNAARELNIPLETVARTMNTVEVNAYKATQQNNEQRQALEDLKISAEEFFRLNADEKLIALAKAYERSTDKAAAYAQILEIVGTKNQAIMTLIVEGAEAIEKQGDAFKYTTEELKKINEAQQALIGGWHAVKIGGADLLEAVLDPLTEKMEQLAKILPNVNDWLRRVADDGMAAFTRAFMGDFSGALSKLFGEKSAAGAGEAAGGVKPAVPIEAEGEGDIGAVSRAAKEKSEARKYDARAKSILEANRPR